MKYLLFALLLTACQFRTYPVPDDGTALCVMVGSGCVPVYELLGNIMLGALAIVVVIGCLALVVVILREVFGMFKTNND